MFPLTPQIKSSKTQNKNVTRAKASERKRYKIIALHWTHTMIRHLFLIEKTLAYLLFFSKPKHDRKKKIQFSYYKKFKTKQKQNQTRLTHV